jgi:catechol 2,3-dioxygenase-like lactoylglutathione lyase family enzyme
MTHRGFSHIGLSTLDLDKTREFYERVLVPYERTRYRL